MAIQILPERDATSVPLNALPSVITGEATSTVTLEDVSAGVSQEVSGTWTKTDLGLGQMRYSFLPTEDLSPDTDYTMTVILSDGEGRAIPFRTGATADEEAPVALEGEPVISESETEDEWGRWRKFDVTTSGSSDESPFWYEVELADNPEFSNAIRRYGSSSSEGLRLRDDPCNIDEAAFFSASDTWVRVTAVDSAGNASNSIWTGSGEASSPESNTGSSGCATATNLPGWLFLLAVPAGFRRRR